MNPVDRADLRGRVAKALTTFLSAQRDLLLEIDPHLADVSDAIEAFVLGGGKRLRPAFAYWGYRGAGGPDTDEVVAAVSALELVQASALIHDDVMDASDTRRGEPAVHRRFGALHRFHRWSGDPDQFGVAGAILLGDLCLVWSDEMLRASGLEPAALLRSRVDFDLMRTEVSAGQYLDMLTQVAGEPSVAGAEKVAYFKSAKYTIERPLLMGASIAAGAPEVRAAYSAYGLPLGIAFQLRDDVLGVFGDPAHTGKPAGDDLREGKRTYLVAATLEMTDARTASELTAHLGDPGLDDAGVARLREIIATSGALTRTERRITELAGRALATLSTVELADDATMVLTELAEAATSRHG